MVLTTEIIISVGVWKYQPSTLSQNILVAFDFSLFWRVMHEIIVAYVQLLAIFSFGWYSQILLEDLQGCIVVYHLLLLFSTFQQERNWNSQWYSDNDVRGGKLAKLLRYLKLTAVRYHRKVHCFSNMSVSLNLLCFGAFCEG